MSQPFLLLLLYLYRFIWSFILIKWIQSIVIPLLQRYPRDALTADHAQLYLAESQFQLLKTSLATPYIYWLIGLILIRMIATPLLNAGIYYSIHHQELEAGYRFFKGIRQLAKWYLLYYWIHAALLAAPALWLWPRLKQITAAYPILDQRWIAAILPFVAAYLVYGFVLRNGFIYLQLGKVNEQHWLRALYINVRHLLPIFGIAILLLLITAGTTTLFSSISWIWASFWAIIVYHIYSLLRTFLDLWGITAQHSLFAHKTNT